MVFPMSAITVQLDDEAEDLLNTLIQKSGRSADQVVSDAIAAMAFEWSSDQPPLTPEEEAAIREGLASLDRGEGVPHEKVMADLKAKYG
jgi:predicted transcriptional regulator